MYKNVFQNLFHSLQGDSHHEIFLIFLRIVIHNFSEASERCQAEKRKTINGEDILFAMSTLGFDNYVEPLKLYLQKYREAMKVSFIVALSLRNHILKILG